MIGKRPSNHDLSSGTSIDILSLFNNTAIAGNDSLNQGVSFCNSQGILQEASESVDSQQRLSWLSIHSTQPTARPDPSGAVFLFASENFSFLLLPDGKIRIASLKNLDSTGSSRSSTSLSVQSAREKASGYTHFCAFSKGDVDKLAALSKNGGQIEVWEVCLNMAAVKTKKTHSIGLGSGAVNFFSRLSWHPLDRNLLLAIGSKSDVFVLSISRLQNNFAEPSADPSLINVLLSIVGGSTLAECPGIQRISHQSTAIKSVSFSPKADFLAKIVEEAACVQIAPTNALDRMEFSIGADSGGQLSMFWIGGTEILLCSATGLRTFKLLPGDPEGKLIDSLSAVSSKKEVFCYGWNPVDRCLYVAVVGGKALKVIHVASDCQLSVAIECVFASPILSLSCGSEFLLIAFDSGVARFRARATSSLPAPNPVYFSETSDQGIRNALDALPSKIEASIRKQISEYLDRTFPKLVEDAVSKAVAAGSKETAARFSEGCDRISGTFSTVRDSITRLVTTLENSVAAGSGLLANSSAAAAVDPDASFRKEIDTFIAGEMYSEAFSKTLNSKNLEYLVYLCSKVDPERVIAAGTLSFPILLSLLQQLCIDLADRAQLKFIWIQESLLWIVVLKPDSHLQQGALKVFSFCRDRLEKLGSEDGSISIALRMLKKLETTWKSL